MHHALSSACTESDHDDSDYYARTYAKLVYDGIGKGKPSKAELHAYGQAFVEMVRERLKKRKLSKADRDLHDQIFAQLVEESMMREQNSSAFF